MLLKKMTPMSQPGSDGLQSNAPTITSEPLGSFTIAARQRSCLSRKMVSRCARVPLPRSGPPSRTSRVGSPPVWESRTAIRRLSDPANDTAPSALSEFHSRQVRARGERLSHQRDDLITFLARQRQSRRTHRLGADADDAFHELDVLHQLLRHVEVQKRREPAIDLAGFFDA